MSKLRVAAALLGVAAAGWGAGCVTAAGGPGGGDADAAARTPDALTLRPASFEPVDDWRPLPAPASPAGLVYVGPEALATGADLRWARTVPGATGTGVRLEFNDAAGRRIYDWTSTHTDQPIAVFADGALISVPTVRAAMSTAAVIAGLSDDAALELVNRLSR